LDEKKIIMMVGLMLIKLQQILFNIKC